MAKGIPVGSSTRLTSPIPHLANASFANEAARLAPGQLRHTAWDYHQESDGTYWRIKARAACFLADGTTVATQAGTWGTLADHWVAQGAGAGEEFTLNPTITTGGIVAGNEYTGNAEYFFRLQNEVYQNPAFTAFLVAGLGSRTVEVGTAFAAGFKAVTWATSYGANVTPNSVSLRDVTSSAVLATAEANDGTLSASTAAFAVVNGESRRYRLAATNTQAGPFSADLVISGAYRLFYGATAAAPASSAAARALPQTQLTSDGNSGTLVTGTTERFFALVLAPGQTLASVIDIGNANTNITASYVRQADLNVADAAGTVTARPFYLRTAAGPYTNPTTHRFTTNG